MEAGEILRNIAAAPIARRSDRDDVHFALANSPNPPAVVHVTDLAAADNAPGFPWTTLYASWDEWAGDTEEG